MKIKNLILIISALLFTSACGLKVVGNADEVGIDRGVWEKAQNELCASGQKLEQDSGAMPRFGDLNVRTKIFAFSKSDADSCILKNSLNDTWKDGFGSQLWFNLNPNSDCFKNNSIWVVRTETYNGSGKYYSLSNVEDRSLPLVDMNAHIAVTGDYVAKVLGLKLLVCK